MPRRTISTGRWIGPIWRDQRFLRVWLGQTASIAGDRVTDIALPWLIYSQTHSALDASLVAAARYVAMFGLGLAAGILADRVARRWLMIGCDLGRALALGSIVALALTRHTAPLWWLVGIVLILGAGQLLFQTAYGAWLPDITGEEQLVQATAALEASDAASTLVGPALGGALIQAIGPALALGADALSYVVSAMMLVGVQDAPMPKRSPFTWRTAWAEVRVGATTILHSREQRLLKGLGSMLQISTSMIGVLLVLLTYAHLHLSAWQAGIVFAAAGAGGLLGSAVAPRAMNYGWRRALGGAFAVAALAVAGLAYAGMLHGTPAFIAALLANAVLDGAAALGFIAHGTASTLLTPREVRGRVNAISSMWNALLRGLALLAAGVLTLNANPQRAFLVLALGYIVAAGVALTRPTAEAGNTTVIQRSV